MPGARTASLSDDLEADRLARAGGRHLEQRPQRLGDAAVAPDDLAHVGLGHVQLDDRPVLAVDDLDRDGVGIVHEGLGDVLDQLCGCHRAAYLRAGQDAGLLEQAADGVGRLGALGHPLLGLGLVDHELDRARCGGCSARSCRSRGRRGRNGCRRRRAGRSAAWSPRRGSGGCGRPSGAVLLHGPVPWAGPALLACWVMDGRSVARVMRMIEGAASIVVAGRVGADHGVERRRGTA